jgi:di/tripeptidase
MSQDILSFKLISGEEVIGYVVSDVSDVLTLCKVRFIQMVQTAPQTIGLNISPYMVSNIDGDIGFYRTAITTVPVTPSADVEKPYVEQTTTIALA